MMAEKKTTTTSKPSTTATANSASASSGKAAGTVSTATSEPANIDAATAFDPSGAPVQIVPDVDPNHPAVDNNPRADTTVDQNRIDFNDPTLSGREAVERNLGYASNDKAAADKDAE